METTLAAPTWALKSVTPTTTSTISYGMSFGETESIVYNFGIQGGKYIVSRINGSNGLVLWNEAYTLGTPTYSLINHKVITTASNVLFVTAGPSVI